MIAKEIRYSFAKGTVFYIRNKTEINHETGKKFHWKVHVMPRDTVFHTDKSPNQRRATRIFLNQQFVVKS